MLLLKGASAVISTNWPVDDSASEEAVAVLYQRLLLGDRTVAECLRAIRRELAAQGAPIGQWAAYSVSGQALLRLSVDKAR
jgi:CHAT domain-containing protein